MYRGRPEPDKCGCNEVKLPSLLAMRGVGKSHLAAVLCEDLVAAGLPVVVLDPIGVFHGLRSSAEREAAPGSV